MKIVVHESFIRAYTFRTATAALAAFEEEIKPAHFEGAFQ